MSFAITYPGAIIRPSTIDHPRRSETLGCCWHWTVGHEAGDITVLDGPNVDCHFYLTKDGDVFQFLDPRSVSWTAMHTSNSNSLQIETEGSGEPWTEKQLSNAVGVGDWISDLFGIPRKHVDPPADWRGHYGHRDLAGIDGNTHVDSVPDKPGWSVFMQLLQAAARPTPPPPADLPFGDSLRLVVNGTRWSGWENAAGPIAWIAKHGLAADATAAIAWRGNTWRGPKDVTNVAKRLAEENFA
jgi:hypothetical protein